MSRQNDKKLTFQIRIDKGWWKILSKLRTELGWSFKALVEYALVEVYTGKSMNDIESDIGTK